MRRAVPFLLMLLSAAVPGAQDAAPGSAGPAGAEFQFVRVIYTNSDDIDRGRRRNSWHTDAPEAETHLLDGIRRLTRVHTAGDSASLRLTDPAIYEHPFLYAVEVGHWHLDDEEVAVLRDYLLHGGFLMVDDFHGTEEWQIFIQSMQRVFPARPIIELGDDHPAFHVLYDLDHRVQIPGIYGAMIGRTWEKDGYVPHWRGIADDDGRLMVALNFNMDLGDAWEHADNPLYPAPLTILAYHFAIDYLLYAMTH